MKTVKKILFVSPSLSMGGQEKMLVALSNLLSKNGYDVTVVIYNPFFDLKAELDDGVRLIYMPPKPKFGKKIPYIRHKFYDYGLWETRASAKQLYRYYVGGEKFDVEIAFFRGRSVKIISGSDDPDSKKLAWVHSDFERCEGIAGNFKSMDEVKKAYGAFDRIICVSNQAESSFGKVIGLSERTVTLRNFVNAAEITEKSKMPCDFKKDCFTVMSVGRLHAVKGYDRLLRACARLDKIRKTRLVLIGGGDQEEKLKALAAELQYDKLTLLGQQENPYKYMRSADLYVCSSHFEGYNLTVAEALVLGLPVLSTDCSGPREILDDGKYGMITENSAEGIYEGMLKLVNDPGSLNKYKNIAKQRKAFFDEKKYLEKIKKIIDGS